MRTRLSVLVVVVSLLLPAGARATGHWYAAAGSPSVNKGLSELWGGHLTGEKSLPNKSRWSAFLDIGKHAGAHDASTLTQFSALVGARRAGRMKNKTHRHSGRPFYAVQPFLHVLGGLIRNHDKAADSSEWAGAVGGGGGLDYLFAPNGGVRAQVDYVSYWPNAGREGFGRFSVGIVYRFEHD